MERPGVILGNVSPVEVRRSDVPATEADLDALRDRIADPGDSLIAATPVELEDESLVVLLERERLPAEDAVTIVRLRDPDPEPRPPRLPAGETLAHVVMEFAEVYRSHHSDDPPEWVAAEDDQVATLMAAQFTPAAEIRPWADAVERYLGEDERG